MKVNFENEVITLANDKTANNLRGAALASIGISETDAESCLAKYSTCTLTGTACCSPCKSLSSLCKIRNSTESISFYLILNIVRKTLLLFFSILKGD